MSGQCGQLVALFQSVEVCLSMDKLGRTQNQDSRNTSFVGWRATKIWAQLVASTTHTCVRFKTQKVETQMT